MTKILLSQTLKSMSLGVLKQGSMPRILTSVDIPTSSDSASDLGSGNFPPRPVIPLPESFKPLSEEERREFFQKTTSLPLNLLNSETSLGGLLQSGGSSESYQELFRAAALAGSLFSVRRYGDFTLPPDESFDLSVFRSAVKLSEEITRKYKADLQNLEPFFNQAELYKRELEPV